MKDGRKVYAQWLDRSWLMANGPIGYEPKSINLLLILAI